MKTVQLLTTSIHYQPFVTSRNPGREKGWGRGGVLRAERGEHAIPHLRSKRL